jgi:hypothetical protein
MQVSKQTKDTQDEKSQFYTGEKSKELIVHIMQNGLEVSKPIKKKIYDREVEWNGRKWPIVSHRFYYDYKGIAHQQVDANDMAVLTYHKDHTDTCRKCGGKMTVDTVNSRKLGRRGIFNAIWGIDNTHLIAIIVAFIIAAGLAGAFMWAFNDASIAKTKLTYDDKLIHEYRLALGLDKPDDKGNTKNADGGETVTK